jgi:two-component system, NarL family, sensor histidine kinase EvgS
MSGARTWCHRLAAVIGLAAAFCLPAMAQPQPPASALRLTDAERAWVAGHPVVRVGTSPGLPPYFTFDANAVRPQGYVIELMDLLAERTGLRFDYQRSPSQAVLMETVARGELDAAAFTPAPADGQGAFLHTRPMLGANMVLAVRRDISDVSPATEFGGYRVAVEAASAADGLLASRFPGAQVQRYDSAEAALRAVASGDADLYIGYRHVAVHYIEKNLLANVQVRGGFGPGLTALGPAVRRDLPLLHAVLDKAMASVTQGEQAQLARRWLPDDADGVPNGAVLTDAERRWVDAHGRIRVGYDAAFAPITLRNDLTQLRGLGADFIRLATGKVGVTIESETGGSFAEIYQRGLKGDIDVLVGAARTTQRRQDFDFVGPFLRVPTGIVTRSPDGPLITRLGEVGHLRMALLQDHFLIPQLSSRYPAIQLLTFPTQEGALQAVAEGRADLAIGNLKVVNQLINDGLTGRVRVTGTLSDADSELYFAVRRDLPELSHLLRKGLDAVSASEAADIERRWLLGSGTLSMSREQAVRLGALLLAMLLVLLTWLLLLRRGNRRLRMARQIERDARRLAEDSTAARGRFISYLTHELRGTIGAIGTGAQMLKENLPPERRQRLADAISESAEGFRSLLETTLQYEQQLERRVELQLAPTEFAALWSQVIAPLELSAQGKGLGFRATLEADSAARVLIDAQRLRQVVNNLVGNAIKFTREGEVTVQGRLKGEGSAVQLELDVCDTGPGLTDEDRLRLFQPYAQGVQGQKLREGAGLGLAITRQIVEAMGGRISAEAAPGGGAVFRVSATVVSA